MQTPTNLLVLWNVKLCGYLWLFISTVHCINLQVSTNDLSFEIGTNSSWSIFLSQAVENASVWIHTNATNPNIVDVYPNEVEIPKNTTEKIVFLLSALNAGHTTLSANASVPYINVNNTFVRIKVMHYEVLDVISTVIGWIYFAAWTISFYPQTYLNWKRKSVVGLNFDFVAFNMMGFVSYSIFNVCLYFVKPIQDEYLSLNRFGLIPVELNDVVFAIHAVTITTLTIFQIIIYEKGNQRLSYTAMGVIGAFVGASIIFAIVIVSGGMHVKTPWLTYVYYFSYVKLGITLIKYCPQAYYNYKRKSTVGWSIWNILLDCTGGTFSILQMFLLAYNYDDWFSIFGNFSKFGLGAISILFDILFFIQHYVLYKDREDCRVLAISSEDVSDEPSPVQNGYRTKSLPRVNDAINPSYNAL